MNFELLEDIYFKAWISEILAFSLSDLNSVKQNPTIDSFGLSSVLIAIDLVLVLVFDQTSGRFQVKQHIIAFFTSY